MFSRNIGRVIDVDSFRVIVELDEDIKCLYKSNFEDIHEIARINSYVILPVGDDKVIGLVTKVNINDETKTNYVSGNITLPKPKRYLTATLVGTIDHKNRYREGVYVFPILDNPVWYILNEDLEILFDYKIQEKIDFKNDFFLPIGKSPVFPNFEIKINPDKFFGKHTAILGNTGSGKSCTVSSILQSLFSTKYKLDGVDRYIEHAHIIIFDINGEYAKAFKFNNDDLNARVNTFTISKEGNKIPYWFMNYDDFDYLFKPSQQTQAPILKRALSLARNNKSLHEDCLGLDEIVLNKLIRFKNLLLENDKNTKSFIIHELDDLLDVIPDKGNKNLHEVYEQLCKIDAGKKKGKLEDSYGIKGDISSHILKEAYDVIDKNISIIMNNSSDRIISNDKYIDMPIYFNFKELITKYIDEALDEMENSKAKYGEYLSSLKLRLSSYLNDDRLNIPFMLNGSNISESLTIYIQYILGMLMPIKEKSTIDDNEDKATYEINDIFRLYKFKYTDSEERKYLNINNAKKESQVTIIDMSLLPYEVIENFAGLLGRLILEFAERIEKVKGYEKKRANFPIALVLEEAQNYIPELNINNERISISKKVFERIAREGRKFGVSLIISSQRPSEISKTVLSQCNTFIVHRLQNPEDQKYIRQVVSSANEDILNQLSILPQQHAIILGEAVKSPVQVKINNANPKPDSDNPEFLKYWIEGTNIDFKKVTDMWINSNN